MARFDKASESRHQRAGVPYPGDLGRGRPSRSSQTVTVESDRHRWRSDSTEHGRFGRGARRRRGRV